MQRLTGLDDGFLWMETATCPMHVASLIVVDSTSRPGGLTFERVRALYESRLDFAPPFRRRLVQAIDDPDESFVLSVDDCNAQLEIVIPLDQCHARDARYFFFARGCAAS